MTSKVLLVTKPLEPPWDDSAKNLARDLVMNAPDVRFKVLTTGRASFELPNIQEEALYNAPGSYAPPLLNNIKVFFRLLRPEYVRLVHFFFAPNPKTSRMVNLALAMTMRKHSIHTVCSAPLSFANSKALFFADTTIAVSEWTRKQLEENGVKDARLIYPAVTTYPAPEAAEITETRRRLGLGDNDFVALYAGDLEFSNAAETLYSALPQILTNPRVNVLYSTRAKTPKAAGILADLERRVSELGVGDRVRFLPAQKDMQALLRAVDVLLMHPDTLYAKMDLPLVLLEAMAHGKTSIIASGGPLPEAFQGEAAGLLVAPGQADALARAVLTLADDRALCARLGETARQVAHERFSLARLAKDYTDVYKECE